MKNLIIPGGLFAGVIVTVVVNAIIRKNSYHKYFLFASTVLVLVFITFDSLRFALKWMPYDPRELVFPDVPVIKAMQEKAGLSRVYGNIGTEVVTYYGLNSLEGYDPLYPKRYGELMRFASLGTWGEAERSVARLDRRGKYTDRVLDLLGVGIIFHPLADTDTSWAYPVWEDYDKYSVIYQDDKFQLYKNNNALSRVKLYYDYEVIQGRKEILQRLFSSSFDYRTTLILEGNVKEAVKPVRGEKAPGKAEILSYTPNKIIIRAESQMPALLFLSDNYYPRWKAFVNGAETQIYRADYTFRAVVLPAGKTEVEFRYQEYL